MKTRLIAMLLGLSILMIIFSGLKMNQAYNAEPTIYYDGQKKEFAFINIKNRDVFTDLKELMPGDRREQEVTFKAGNINKNTKIFLNVNKNNYDKSIMQYIKIFANDKELVKDKEYIELANFSKDNVLKLKVVVDVPKEAGNELQDLKYNMDWNILVQEENEKLIDVPNTYDNINITLYIIIIILSIIIMIYSIRQIIKMKDKNKNKV